MVWRKAPTSTAGDRSSPQTAKNSAEKWARTSASVKVAAAPASWASTHWSCRPTGLAGRMALAQVLIR
jgi:hypothetical protein